MIGDDGVAAMLEAGLGHNTSLKYLDIGDNWLCDAGCMALARWAEARFFPLQNMPAHCTQPRAATAAVGAASLGSILSGSGVPPPVFSVGAAPLVVCFDSSDDIFDLEPFDNIGSEHEVSAAVEASIRRIVDRVNAAADAAGWRWEAMGRPALTFNI
jgi:hypothetical protein